MLNGQLYRGVVLIGGGVMFLADGILIQRGIRTGSAWSVALGVGGVILSAVYLAVFWSVARILDRG